MGALIFLSVVKESYKVGGARTNRKFNFALRTDLGPRMMRKRLVNRRQIYGFLALEWWS